MISLIVIVLAAITLNEQGQGELIRDRELQMRDGYYRENDDQHADMDRTTTTSYDLDVKHSMRSTSSACQSASSVRNLPPGKPLNIVLLGKTGHGKSATANSIFGDKDLFNSEMSSCSVTTKCQKETGIIGGRKLSVVDTPGTMDTNHKDEALEEIGTSITLVPEGFDAFVIVLRVDVRITEEEKEAINLLKKLFGPNTLLKYGILVFTYGDTFMKSSKMTFQEHMLSQKGDMKNILADFGYRSALIDNTQKDPAILREQVIQIITIIDLIVSQNGGQRYSNDLFVMAQRELQAEKNREKAIQERRRQEEIDSIVARRLAEELKRRSDCFPPDGLVTLHDGRTITIADLRIGHKVLSNAASGTLEYSEVYFFAHLNPNVSNEYINLRTFKQNIKLSPQHHIYIVRNGHMKTIAAREVKIGDRILVLNKESLSFLNESITEISISTEFGVYAPITMSGTIVVNNILASCYVDLVPPVYSHPMLWPLRQLYRLSPTLSAQINAAETYGMPNWVQFIMDNLLI
ncbi:hypothetical protein CHS0354_038726 [Potamilus streckersoni]|uniref:AIG1-type G domain-containing protein n=1 Tax=Potamilus streckersoni TaxID=2493646 RepID=A0AAE0VU54_9BIVA|nr:hypothetical protein CHS0354_038726 [Potamilus streckersoni]